MAGERLPLYILAGGHSSRFGRDKARARVNGEPLLLQVAQALAPCAASCTVVADSEGKYADLGLRTIADPTPGLGPLAGLQAALGDLEPASDWLLLAACDWLNLSAAWAELLLDGRGASSRAVAFRGTVWEPLFSLYHRGLAEEVARRLGEGRLALWRLLEEVEAVPLPLPADWERARQVNQPGDLDAGRPTDRGVSGRRQ